MQSAIPRLGPSLKGKPQTDRGGSKTAVDLGQEPARSHAKISNSSRLSLRRDTIITCVYSPITYLPQLVEQTGLLCSHILPTPVAPETALNHPPYDHISEQATIGVSTDNFILY